MVRVHTINVPATREALGRLAQDEPSVTRLAKLDALFGAAIRAMHDRGFEPDDITAAVHRVNAGVPLPELTKTDRPTDLSE